VAGTGHGARLEGWTGAGRTEAERLPIRPARPSRLGLSARHSGRRQSIPGAAVCTLRRKDAVPQLPLGPVPPPKGLARRGDPARVPEATFYFSDQDGWEMEVIDPDGTLVRLIGQEWDPVRVPEEDRRAHVEDVVGPVGDPSQASRIRAYLGGLPNPDHVPPFGELVADLEDCPWVQDFQRPGAENRTWSVFDPEGVRAPGSPSRSASDPWRSAPTAFSVWDGTK